MELKISGFKLDLVSTVSTQERNFLIIFTPRTILLKGVGIHFQCHSDSFIASHQITAPSLF